MTYPTHLSALELEILLNIYRGGEFSAPTPFHQNVNKSLEEHGAIRNTEVQGETSHYVVTPKGLAFLAMLLNLDFENPVLPAAKPGRNRAMVSGHRKDEKTYLPPIQSFDTNLEYRTEEIKLQDAGSVITKLAEEGWVPHMTLGSSSPVSRSGGLIYTTTIVLFSRKKNINSPDA